jgi:hypothetical protein
MKHFDKLLAQVRDLQKKHLLPIRPTDDQRADWAYGNAVIENKDVTIEMARKAASKPRSSR